MKLSEYEVKAMPHGSVDDPSLPGNSADVSCQNCIFSPYNENLDVCFNYGMHDDSLAIDVLNHGKTPETSLPDCRDSMTSSNAGEYGTIYKLVHKLSGQVLTAKDAVDLVEYYKGKSHE